MTVLKVLYTNLAVGTARFIVTSTRYVNLCFSLPVTRTAVPRTWQLLGSVALTSMRACLEDGWAVRILGTRQ